MFVIHNKVTNKITTTQVSAMQEILTVLLWDLTSATRALLALSAVFAYSLALQFKLSHSASSEIIALFLVCIVLRFGTYFLLRFLALRSGLLYCFAV